jgi:hypothetical protein
VRGAGRELKASIEPAKQAQPETPETADGLDPVLARLRKLHAVSFPTPPARQVRPGMEQHRTRDTGLEC